MNNEVLQRNLYHVQHALDSLANTPNVEDIRTQLTRELEELKAKLEEAKAPAPKKTKREAK